ncbi:MAG: hypothetical protein ABL997_02590 [Planctomycetota bacterium]
MNVCDPLTTELLARGPYVRRGAPFHLVHLKGPDAGDFLQRLCSQDVLALGVGQMAPAAFLDSKGKLLVTCLVSRLADGFALEMQAHQAERLCQLLERYHFTEKITIVPPAPSSTCTEWIAAAGSEEPMPTSGVRIAWTRRGISFVRVHGESEALPQLAASELGDDLAECLRMAAGIVKVLVDTEPTTLALEAFLDDHCSATKGCYTGQEIVARIHTYGHTNRALCLLDLSDGPRLSVPVVLREPEDDLPVGRVMAAVPIPGHARRRSLGYLPKDFQAAGTKLTLEGGGEVVVIATFVEPA